MTRVHAILLFLIFLLDVRGRRAGTEVFDVPTPPMSATLSISSRFSEGSWSVLLES